MQIIYFFLLKCLFVVSSHSYVYPWKVGDCKDIQPMENFEPKKYFSGIWYEHKSTNNYLVPADRKCLTIVTYYRSENTIEAIFYWNNARNKTYEHFNGVIDAKTKDFEHGLARFVYTPEHENGGTPFTLLDTDYENYVVAYSCTQRKELISDMFWVLKRQRSSTAFDDKIGNILSQVGMNYTDFKFSANADCPPVEPTI